MPEVDKYSFTYKEIVELLVKQAGLHDGRWQLVASFSISGTNAGPSEDQVVPAAVVGVTSMALQKAAPESPSSLTVDAAKVNPASKRRKKS